MKIYQNSKHKIKRSQCAKYLPTWELKETKKQIKQKKSNIYARSDHKKTILYRKLLDHQKRKKLKMVNGVEKSNQEKGRDCEIEKVMIYLKDILVFEEL